MEFTFTHRCPRSGPELGLVLFDETHGGVFGLDDGSAVPLPLGSPVQLDLSCIPGATICYGAADPSGTFVWGVGLQNLQECSELCCVSCASGQVEALDLLCS
jgi:hypothetical protein